MYNFYIAAFLADLALGAVLLSLPLLLIYKFDASYLTLGLLGALGAFVYSFSVVTFGRLSDRFNRKSILIFGCFLFIVSYSIIPYLEKVNQIFIIYIFGSISMAMFWPTIQSWLSQGLSKDNLLKSLRIFNVSWSAGLMLGFLSAGLFFSLNPKIPFIFAIFLVVIVILLLFRQPVLSETTYGSARETFLETEKSRPKSSIKFLYIAWCANFLSWFILGVMRNLFPKLGTGLGFSTPLIGTFMFVIILAQTAMFFILGKRDKYFYRLGPILLFQSLAFVSLLIITFSSTASYFLLAMVFLGLSNGMTYFSSIFYSLYGAIDKGKRSGLHEGFLGAGTLSGPLIGGFAAHIFGIRAPYLATALLLVAVMIVELIINYVVKDG